MTAKPKTLNQIQAAYDDARLAYHKAATLKASERIRLLAKLNKLHGELLEHLEHKS